MANEVKVIEIKIPAGEAIKTIVALTEEINKLKTAEVSSKEQIVQNNIAIKEYTRQKQVLTREVQNEYKAAQTATGAYQKLQTAYQVAAQKAKDLAAGNTATAKEIQNAATKANTLNQRLKDIDKTIGNSQRYVGEYERGMAGASAQMAIMPGQLGAIGIALQRLGVAFITFMRNPYVLAAAAIIGLVSAFKAIVTSSIEFDKQMSSVKAVTNATSEEMVKLTDNAKYLGQTTLKTATEVAQLQVELAKLGFTSAEIVNMTSAITDLSIATGADLARSAEVAGVAMRGFGLNSLYSTHVADVMAKSFSTSALDLEKFAESIKYVAPIAKVTNTSLEETTAMLATLANVGISGSNAGTALRMIMLKLGEQSGTLTEKIQKLQKKGLGLADANSEVGQRAMTALVALAKQSDMLPQYTDRLVDANGAVKQMADTMSDNLAGDITLADSAWDGFMKSLEDGKGPLSNAARWLVKLKMDIYNALASMAKSSEQNALEAQNKAIQSRLALTKQYLVVEKDKLGYINAEMIKEKNIYKQKEKRIEQLKYEIEQGKNLGGAWDDNNEAREKEVAVLQKSVEASKKYVNELGGIRKLINDENTRKQIEDTKLITKETEEQLKERLAAEKEAAKERERLRKEAAKERVAEEVARIKAQEDALKQAAQYLQDSIKADDLEAESSLKKQLEVLKQKSENYQNYLSDNLEIAQLSGADELEAQKAILDARMNQELSVAELTKKEIQAIKAKYKLLNDQADGDDLGRKFGKIKEFADAGLKIATESSNLMSAISDRELANYAAKNKNKIGFDEAYAAKKLELEIQAAKREKALSIFSTIINTAAAVVEALPNPFLAAAAGVAGAAQLATIIATPLPTGDGSSYSSGSSSVASVPDTTSKMAMPLNAGADSIGSYGGADTITSGAANAQTMIQYDLMGNAMMKAVASLPPQQLSINELRTKEKQVDLLDNLSTYKS